MLQYYCQIITIFQVSENSIITILPALTVKQQLSLDEKAIADQLSRGIHLASSEIAQKTGFSKDKVVRLLKNLLANNYVQKEGFGRGTKYYLR